MLTQEQKHKFSIIKSRAKYQAEHCAFAGPGKDAEEDRAALIKIIDNLLKRSPKQYTEEEALEMLEKWVLNNWPQNTAVGKPFWIAALKSVNMLQDIEETTA